MAVFQFFDGVELVEEAGGWRSPGKWQLRRWPRHRQPVQSVLALLDALLVADGAGLGAFGPAETAALVADDGSTAESSLAAVITPTATRVRRKTASMISLWL